MKVNMDECWLWAGHVTSFGYGRIRIGKKDYSAHRLIYEAIIGEVPAGLELDHLCRRRNCINPAHLEPVTHLENVRRGNAGINHRSKTRCKRGHEFTELNTYLYKSFRHCKECRRVRRQIRKQKGILT